MNILSLIFICWCHFLIAKSVQGLSFPIFSELAGIFSARRARLREAPRITLMVQIPMSSVHYDKPLEINSGGRFFLETPMERYAYSSAGRSNLFRVNIAYHMQSMYRPDLTCFFLHFWSMKDPRVPWNVPRLRIPPPYWSRYNYNNMERNAPYYGQADWRKQNYL